MCLTAFAFKTDPDYPLVIIANRDEFYNRPTKDAHRWNSKTGIIAGKDLMAGGIWTGINQYGKIALLTNYRDPSLHKESQISRGNIPLDFLKSHLGTQTFLEKLEGDQNQYNGYNLIAGDSTRLFYTSNMETGYRALSPGFYGLSNHLLDSPWPKTERVKNAMQNHLRYCDQLSIDTLLDILKDRKKAADEDLPETGIPVEWERELSSVFIQSETYGTRASTIILVNKEGQLIFVEQNYTDQGIKGKKHKFSIAVMPQ